VSVRILTGDCLAVLPTLPAESVQLVVTSPPYFALRSYLDADHPGKGHEIGSEPTPDAFVATMVDVFREVRRVLRTDGCCVINLGDSMSGSGKGPTGKNGIQNAEQRQGFESGYLRENGEWSRGGRKSKTEGTAGIPPKNLLMIPFRVAMALQADGWILRSVMPWVKRNSMPESVQDRPATAVEYLFLLSKNPTYFWDSESIRVPVQPSSVARVGQNDGHPRWNAERQRGYPGSAQTLDINKMVPSAGRSYRNSDPFFATWQGLMLDEAGEPLALVVNPRPNPLAHFASFPAGLVEPFVKAGSRPGDTVLDPFGGSGTTGLVAERLGRDAILIELNPQYAEMARARIHGDAPMFASVELVS
jgi:DNA modification methylase